jgi:uncharacterized protein (DUF305 family)
MNNNTTTIVSAIIISLAIGILGGYLVWGSREAKAPVVNNSGMHAMPDGSMMSDDGSSMASMMDSMNAGLIGKTGDAFDQAFLAEMIVHHQGAVEMAKLALTNAKHQEIKTLAEGIISAQNKEIAEMKQWQKEWFAK